MVLVLGLAVAACSADESAFGASDERFVRTMVALRHAALEAGADTTRFEQLRREVLEEHGMTEADLRAYVDANAGDLDHMAAVWDSVSARLSEPAPE
jgi:hypothetical protein